MPYRRPNHGFNDRMLQIDAILQRGKSTNCRKLGEALNVDQDTIQRDINYMRDRLDLPIEYDERHHTYRYTQPVSAFPTVKMTEGDAFALMIARKTLDQFRGTSYHRSLAASFAKLSAGLRNEVSFSPTEATHAVSFKHTGVGKTDLETFQALNRGVMRQLEVEFAYRKPGDRASSPRRVQPYHLSHRENLWYLVAFDLARGALRTFALPRISRVECTDKKFVRPADFSAEKYFASALGVMGGDGDYRIAIRFRGAAADRVREREWHESEVMRDLPDGRLELRLWLGSLFEVERWILSWGADAEVLKPAVLRKNIAKTAEAMAKQYRSEAAQSEITTKYTTDTKEEKAA